MVADLPTDITIDRTRKAHIADHNRLHARTRHTVYSDDYATLQAAVDDADAKRRPLVIAPGVHSLTEPLRLHDLSRSDICAYGATLQAANNLPALVDLADCRRIWWRGGRLQVPDGVTVDNAMYIRRAVGSATKNNVSDLIVEGSYTTGLRIGTPDDTGQNDYTCVTGLECIGRNLTGQVGLHVGTGRFGNCLNHTFRNVSASGHGTHIVVSATNAYFDGVFMDRSAVTDWYAGTNKLSVRNIRSESGNRLLVTGGPATYAAQLAFDHVWWSGDDMAADGEMIQAHLAGLLRLTDLDIRNPTVEPHIMASLAAPLAIDVDGLVSQYALARLFDVSPSVQTSARNYVQVDANGSVQSITGAS